MRGLNQNALAKSTSPEGFKCAVAVALRGRLHPTRSARKALGTEGLCLTSRACVGGYESTAVTKCVSPCEDGALFSRGGFLRGINQNALAKSSSPVGFTCAAAITLRGRLHPSGSARKASVVEDLCVRSRACVGDFGSTAVTKCVSPCDEGDLFSELFF